MSYKQQLDRIRMPESDHNFYDKTRKTILIFLLGIALGVLSKALDNLPINDEIWWQHILGILDLRNVFSGFGVWIFIAVAISVLSKSPLRASVNVFVFFVGMTTSYHLYTILFSGFNPQQYMMIWYVLTLFTPIFAYVCWYGKGKGIFALMISCGILALMLLRIPNGMGSRSVNVVLYIATFFVLTTDKKRMLLNLFGSVVIAMVVYGLKYYL